MPRQKSYTVKVTNNDGDDGNVLLVVNGKHACRAVEVIGSVLGSSWECMERRSTGKSGETRSPKGGAIGTGDTAYAIVSNYPGVMEELRQEFKGTGFKLDFSEFTELEEFDSTTEGLASGFLCGKK